MFLDNKAVKNCIHILCFCIRTVALVDSLLVEYWSLLHSIYDA